MSESQTFGAPARLLSACTYCAGCDGDGDGGDEGEVIPGEDAVPQGRQDEGQRQPVPGGSVVTHPETDGRTDAGGQETEANLGWRKPSSALTF